jgi:hypothetical protein
MSSTPKDLIAKRAYEIWEKDGRANGRHEEHWLRAEKEFAAKHAPLRELAAAKPEAIPARKAAAAENRPARLTQGPKKPGRR